MKAINTNEGFYNSQIIQSNVQKLMYKTEENNFFYKKSKNSEKEKKNEDDKNDDIDSKDMMDMIEEGKAEEIKKFPNYSGIIHNKRQLENNNINIKKNENGDNCIII